MKPDFQLLPGTSDLIENLRASLDFGHTLKTKTLLTRAEHYLKAPVNSGHYDFRYLYDVIETALHQVIEKRAAAFREMDSAEAFQQIERLLSQLPTQRVRTNEQTLYQQFSPNCQLSVSEPTNKRSTNNSRLRPRWPSSPLISPLTASSIQFYSNPLPALARLPA